MAWLKASGIIPFVVEPGLSRRVDDMTGDPTGMSDLWQFLLRTAHIPWADIGCDRRLGIDQAMPAKYTAYDHLFHNESKSDLRSAIPGLAEKIRKDRGSVVSTLFAFGALTPLRNLIVASKRHDPNDVGNYQWAIDGQGFNAQFWDNARFSHWIKQLWESGQALEGIKLAREGRFVGISVDAMNVSRQAEPFFKEADRIKSKTERVGLRLSKSSTCHDLFSYRLQ